MNCHEIELYLAEYATGRLDDEGKRTVDAHLKGCPGCRETLAGMEEFFRVAAAVLPSTATAGEESPERLWEGLQSRIRAEGLDGPEKARGLRERIQGLLQGLGDALRSLPPKPALVGLAAVALAVLGIGYYNLRPLSPEQKTRLQQEAAAELEEIEGRYVEAIDKYSRLVERSRDSIDPELYEMYEDKLAVLDDYIAGCKAAIEENRFNINAREHLFFAYREKVETLREMLSGGST